jgi:TatD-related deoxyribonuclease
MESDFMDENSRPGAVIGPRSVPRYTNQLVASGIMTVEDCFFVHAETVERVYGVTVQLR